MPTHFTIMSKKQKQKRKQKQKHLQLYELLLFHILRDQCDCFYDSCFIQKVQKQISLIYFIIGVGIAPSNRNGEFIDVQCILCSMYLIIL